VWTPREEQNSLTARTAQILWSSTPQTNLCINRVDPARVRDKRDPINILDWKFNRKPPQDTLVQTGQVLNLWIKTKSLIVRLTQSLFFKFVLVQLHVSAAFDHHRAISIVPQSKVKNEWQMYCRIPQVYEKYYNTGRFIMFSVITSIYNKKTKGPTLMQLFTATRKVIFLQLEMFDVCTTGDTAHIDTIFKFLPHTRQHGCIDILHCCSDPCL